MIDEWLERAFAYDRATETIKLALLMASLYGHIDIVEYLVVGEERKKEKAYKMMVMGERKKKRKKK